MGSKVSYCWLCWKKWKWWPCKHEVIAYTCKYWNISVVSAVFIEIFQHNQQYDTLLPVTPCAHKLKAGIALYLERREIYMIELKCNENKSPPPPHSMLCVARMCSIIWWAFRRIANQGGESLQNLNPVPTIKWMIVVTDTSYNGIKITSYIVTKLL
jgi:hypothetical protein